MKIQWKLIVLLALLAGMIVALNVVRGLVFERQQRADEVRAEIAQFSAGEQTIRGPFLVLPYLETVATLTETETPKGKTSAWTEQTVSQSVLISPDQLNVNGQLAVENLKRGIFEAPIYRGNLLLNGRFSTKPLNQYERQASSTREKITRRWGKPYLMLSLADVRGIQQLSGTLAEQTLSFNPGTGEAALGSGVNADIQLNPEAGAQDFKLQLKLNGTTQLLIEPVGDETQVALAGNWPHPSFSGNFSPAERHVTAQGFTARWQTSLLATGGSNIGCAATVSMAAVVAVAAVEVATANEANHRCESSPAALLGLRLIDPVDRYVLNERTLKYAELFVLVMFGAVFLMSVMKKVAIHPVQYALVGAALALFFLLTLSLSEHIGFSKAYWIAASASTLLLGFYISFVLMAWQRGVGFAVVLAGLYGLLFGILQSEDMALLMGSLTLFGLLSGVMILTRKFDWQGLSQTIPSIIPNVISTDESQDEIPE